MKKYFLAAAFLATACNLAIGADSEASSNLNLYILAGFGAIVITLTLAVWWLTSYVGSTLVKIFSSEADLQKTIHKTMKASGAKPEELVLQRLVAFATTIILLVGVGVAVVYGRREDEGQAVSNSENVIASVESFHASNDPLILEKGKTVFQTNCTPCHGPAGGGNQIGPNLTDTEWIHGGKPEDVYNTIKNGVAAKAMPEWGKTLASEDVSAVASYVLTMGK